jgi:hypothetical protein
MKRNHKTLALLTLFGALATGCQKEELFCPDNQYAIAQVTSTVTMKYSLDGTEYLSVITTEEYYDFVFMMLTMAEQGHSVSFCEVREQETGNASKESVIHKTKDREDAIKWSSEMGDEGYTVEISYDEQTGVYTCIAFR